MAEITILGSSSGNPSPDRANASLILKAGDGIYQFDAGEGFSSSALRHNIDHHKIKAIIISHMHPDHTAGLFLEIQMMYLAKRTAPLAVLLPEEGIAAVKGFMLAGYLFPERLGFDLSIKPIRPDPAFRDGNVAVYVRANTHLSHYRKSIEDGGYPNLMQSYSYVIKADARKIIYSGDIGSFDDYADLLDGCDLLITEGLHVDIETLFEKSAQSGLKRIVLTHLSADMFRKPESILTLAAKWGIDEVQVAEDGMKLDI